MIADNTTIGGSVVDGVHRHPANNVSVVVLGGGIGGLQAALECWRKGCEVVVIERAQDLSSLGDYFTITPSGLTTLKDYPSMHADYHQAVYDCSISVYTPSGDHLLSLEPEWNRGIVHAAPDVSISFLKRRPVWAQMQMDQLNRLKVPVYMGDKAVSVCEEEDRVIVTTSSGNTFVCDVCIGANGVGSIIPGFDTGPEIAVQDTGYAIARLAFPRSAIKEGSPASALLNSAGTRPEFRTYVGNDIHLILFLTQDWVAFAFTHRDYDDAQESWSNVKDVSEVIQYLEKANEDWDPAVLDFVRSAPAGVVDWKLRLRDSTPQWTSTGGRLLRLGDSAHTFLPTSGNGAVQALEDALSIGECLHIGGKAGVKQATKVHNTLRAERVSILQQMGLVNREELHHFDIAAVKENFATAAAGFFKIGKWVWNHDAERYAHDNYEHCLAEMAAGHSFKNTNIPQGHVYQPWTLESERKRMEAGIKSNLKLNGDWSV